MIYDYLFLAFYFRSYDKRSEVRRAKNFFKRLPSVVLERFGRKLLIEKAFSVIKTVPSRELRKSLGLRSHGVGAMLWYNLAAVDEAEVNELCGFVEREAKEWLKVDSVKIILANER
ncbi:MAG: hypothetical protein QXS32_08470 [Candidatus Nezhaarchaeales archaeon]